MGNVNAWVCACERERGAGNKCENIAGMLLLMISAIICVNTTVNAKRNSVGDKYG